MRSKFFSMMLSLLIVFISFNCINAQFQAQELSSIYWIRAQYGLEYIPQTETAICSSMVFFCEMGTDNFNHIVSINVNNIIYTDAGATPSLTEFSFPALTELKINVKGITQVYDPMLNILNLIKNIPLLTLVEITGDQFSSIPLDFPTGCPLFVNLQSNLTTIQISSTPINSITIDQSTFLPMLKILSISIICNLPQTYTITAASFPILSDLSFIGSGGDQQVNIMVEAPVLYLTSYISDKTVVGYINPTISHPEVVKGLKYGGGSNYAISPSDLSLYTNLEGMQIVYSGLTTFPVTPYPKVLDFYITHSNLQSLPNVPIPSNARELICFNFAFVLISSSFINNQMTGNLPTNLLDNSPTKVKIVVSLNPGITGTMGQEYCYIQGIFLDGTAISSIPDCYWCYPNGRQIIFGTDLPEPSTPNCTVTINSLDIVSINGGYSIEGDNIGWGRGLQHFVSFGSLPNKRLLFQDFGYTSKPFNYNLTLILAETFTFNVTEVGFQYSTVSLNSDTLFMFEVTITFLAFNPSFLPTFHLDSTQQECIVSKVDIDQKVMKCILENPQQGSPVLIMDNGFSTNEAIIYLIQKPVITSYSLEPPTYPPTTLNLYGYFSTLSFPNNTQVYVNYTIDLEGLNPCNVTLVSPTHISCLFTKVPKPGLTDMALVTDNGSFLSSIMPFFPAPIPTVDDCKTKTNNCNGHGTCTNGQCLCDQGWTDFDCKIETKTAPGVIIQPNYTDPNVNFTSGDYSFSFSMVSIQELDYQNNLVMELFTDKWNVTSKANEDLTRISYILTSQKNKSVYDPLIVNSVIEFSNKSRSVEFGGETIQLAEGAIKIAVNITNWPYQTLMSTLRVVFSTVVNNNQAIIGCGDSYNPIDTFQQSADNGTLQYLRVVKDNVQFFGRFLDYIVSDGRKTFSKTEIMNITSIGDPAANQSLALIGIHTPTCRSCLIDPDFSALLVDRSNYDPTGACSEPTNNSNWKIIVGIVAGVVGAVAIAIGSWIYVKKTRKSKKFNTMMQNKLQAFSESNK
ncbi:hypothetical protein DFA_08586 [Cavenderia fasciculata]|uniref:EGF-like domain-containing protein n=1 Tax=Cavenderia fasciculata TaxID=261658 RepID=F4Q380_CACFS|nr:uncharacterized protein DFA_08586 [Cavenderia fasciculata]EGG17590.1 hypothetical protein DFA_08586 [Cavenderia fasciculata]|eukprot:XP_004356074.1 hypothetical protein DFA_08586 [Cavenderia fasciculata]